MQVEEFECWWETRDRADLQWLADAVAAALETADGTIERLRASREVARINDRAGRHRRACAASHRIRLSALQRCDETGLRSDDPAGTIRLARAAGSAAEALVAGSDRPCAQLLLRPFVGVALPIG